MSSSPLRAYILVAGFQLHLVASLQPASAACIEGSCRASTVENMVDICGSGRWQQMHRGSYQCSNGKLDIPSTTSMPSTSTSENVPSFQSTGVEGVNSSGNDKTGMTGNAMCTNSSPTPREDSHGTATYKFGGRMASVYSAGTGSIFRCDIDPPENGYFVAVWTRYDASKIAQPQPKNCGEILELRNPRTGRSANAIVIDRCQSCVGVGYQASDPTTPDIDINGATVDLSWPLWNYLFDFPAENREGSVYDVWYNGTVYGGEGTGLPDLLSNPRCIATAQQH